MLYRDERFLSDGGATEVRRLETSSPFVPGCETARRSTFPIGLGSANERFDAFDASRLTIVNPKVQRIFG